MISYTAIIKQSYYITIRHPLLWIFGLFAVGAFNVNLFHFQNISFSKPHSVQELYQGLMFFKDHPGVLALASSSLLLFAILGLVLTNWSRIMLALSVDGFIEHNQMSVGKHLKRSVSTLWTVISISLFTTTLMVLVAVLLFLPPLLLLRGSPQIQSVLLACSAVIFLPLSFTVSSVNIFTIFFAIFFKKRMASALDLGTDFFVSRWMHILGLLVVLFVIYIAGFMLGISIIYIIKVAFNLLFAFLLRFNIFPLSAIILVPQLVASVLLWVLLAGLSVFFNTAIYLLFMELITPVTAEPEKFKVSLSVPVNVGR